MPADQDTLLGSPRQPLKASGKWTGMAGLSIVQREQLAEMVVPRVIEHLERCLSTARDEWEAGRTWGNVTGNPLLWANDFRMFEKRVTRDFQDTLMEDFRSHDYPPQYEFSGVAFADQDDGLSILDDYQSTRRSLRHKLEGSMRENNRYSHYVFTQAAREKNRFEHPNWAPWSPLHWYERLIEIGELYFGKTEMTLDLMRSYLDCMQKTAAPTLAFVVEAIEHCGLITETPAAPESSETLRRNASWKRLAGARDTDASAEPDADPATTTSGWRPSTRKAEADEPARMPDTEADPAQWAAWASNMVQSPVFRPVEGDGGGQAAGSAGSGNAAPMTAFVMPSDQPDPRASLMPFIHDLLQGLFDHIFREVGFNPAVRAEIGEMQYPLATAVIRDLGFFRDRSHPLRLWIGSLINVAIRINPESEPDSEDVERYLGCIRRSIEYLRNRADRLDRDSAEVLMNQFLESVENEDALWHARQITQIDLPNAEEWAEQARRNLALAALETGADLPETAAEEIFQSWETVLAVEHDAGEAGEALHRVLRQVVRHICNMATAAEVNPLVVEAKEHARAAGLGDDRIRDLVQHLGKAHLYRLRAPEDAERFDPRARLQTRESVRYEDDDPTLDQDRDDDHVFAAIGLDIGDWFEFCDDAGENPRRLALIWRGDTTRRFFFLSLDGVHARRHSLQGVAQELRQGRMRALPEDNPLDAIIEAPGG
ncbi:DUF1631 family protein [Thioalkalivibrio sp. ALE9]|uniref:DUF1631 family protein n=1 Tax=Thioalkalivibrio sp. ALE9 TaxID=1158169 RepID=UPI0003743BD3|nr:DUF1631 family protein [Thioalkalivibrio sp. ALE9]